MQPHLPKRTTQLCGKSTRHREGIRRTPPEPPHGRFQKSATVRGLVVVGAVGGTDAAARSTLRPWMAGRRGFVCTRTPLRRPYAARSPPLREGGGGWALRRRTRLDTTLQGVRRVLAACDLHRVETWPEPTGRITAVLLRCVTSQDPYSSTATEHAVYRTGRRSS